jgi:hypothetical protein
MCFTNAGPDFDVAHDSRGFAHPKMQDADGAIADYAAALKAYRKPAASALYGRGLAKHIKGDTTGADAGIAAAKQLDPQIMRKFEGYGLRGR